jgi:hypothetical protein
MWSDGDDYPEMIIDWYKQSGYDFVALSDHNILSVGEKWIDVDKSRGGRTAYNKYLDKYGTEWINQKNEEGTLKVRLKTLAEFRSLFEEPAKFLLIQSEEITDEFEEKPVHLNATNIQKLIPPQGGNNIREVLQNNVDAVLKQRKETGLPILPHVNHPNFGWALTAEDLIALKGEKFFEIYNGHPSVRNDGDSLHPNTDKMWDIILTKRLLTTEEIMYGVAVDDAHNYHDMNVGKSNPGRGWIMVNSSELKPESLIEAMEDGKFYASTGVTLEEINRGEKGIFIKIKSEDGVTYTTQFFGTLKDYESSSMPVQDQDGIYVTQKYSSDVGRLLKEVSGHKPEYNFNGNEIYVRAKVISSKNKQNPFKRGEKETAWIQPVVVK